MKTLSFRSFACLVLLGTVNIASAILITDFGINVTNSGGALVADVPQATLANQNPSTQFAWLQSQVSGYNAIPGPASPLPAPTGVPGSPTIQDDDASDNGSYSLLGGSAYYIVSHYGKSNTAWYIAPTASGSYGMPSQASSFGGAGKGLSNVRIWKVGVPDGGTTIALLGLGILGLAFVRRRIA